MVVAVLLYQVYQRQYLDRPTGPPRRAPVNLRRSRRRCWGKKFSGRERQEKAAPPDVDYVDRNRAASEHARRNGARSMFTWGFLYMDQPCLHTTSSSAIATRRRTRSCRWLMPLGPWAPGGERAAGPVLGEAPRRSWRRAPAVPRGTAGHAVGAPRARTPPAATGAKEGATTGAAAAVGTPRLVAGNAYDSAGVPHRGSSGS
jgi:hypothetical protein